MPVLTRNIKHNSRVKHIDIRHHFVCKCVENGEIIVPSSENLTNVLTKPLRCIAHHRACIMLQLCEDTEPGGDGEDEDGFAECVEPGGVL